MTTLAYRLQTNVLSDTHESSVKIQTNPFFIAGTGLMQHFASIFDNISVSQNRFSSSSNLISCGFKFVFLSKP